ncbi:sugar epimerase [Chryseobacterium sp. CH21]|uniref:sugar epimerase n=1 Tax=Chryseobacterium sp. CH21 TaxID=713556 RepID=UPI001E489C93|nr:sugar epimerase [Chryseobacterium sp. CH21]
MDQPEIIKGENYSDIRGNLFFNNKLDLSNIKRLYYIENANTELIRGWTGHKVEQRWFSVVYGSFIIRLIKIDNWENPNVETDILEFKLNADQLDVLHMPKGYASAIQAKEKNQSY